ncbi:MAG: hypothetical protein WB952_24705 [Terriglobales bacterium]
MKENEDDKPGRTMHHSAGNQPLVVRVTGGDFQCEVLQKLARLEAKMDMLAGRIATRTDEAGGRSPHGAGAK